MILGLTVGLVYFYHQSINTSGNQAGFYHIMTLVFVAGLGCLISAGTSYFGTDQQIRKIKLDIKATRDDISRIIAHYNIDAGNPEASHQLPCQKRMTVWDRTKLALKIVATIMSALYFFTWIQSLL